MQISIPSLSNNELAKCVSLDEADSLGISSTKLDELPTSKEPAEQTVVQVDGMEEKLPARILKAMERNLQIALNKQKMKGSSTKSRY